MSEPVRYEENGGIVVLTLNRPELRNPITDDDMIEGIVASLERMDRDPKVRAAIVTGAGSAFSSGGNLKKMGDPEGVSYAAPVAARQFYRHGIQRIPLAFDRLEVPVIAAVNGPAIGAGCDLACMCDIRIAGASARFAESFVKVGIIPGDGGAWLLPRVVGYSKASEMAFTGDMLDAQEALRCGLVSQVVPDDELLSAAQALCGRIAANPPHAVRMTKRLLREGRQTSLDTLLQISAGLQAIAHSTSDHREATTAFISKRPPKFTGN